MSASDQVTITHSPSRERYVLSVGDVDAGYLDYVAEIEQLVVTHTVVYDRFAGQGLAGRLVKHVLDDARSKHLRVVPVCSYVAAYIERNPEYADLAVAPQGR